MVVGSIRFQRIEVVVRVLRTQRCLDGGKAWIGNGARRQSLIPVGILRVVNLLILQRQILLALFQNILNGCVNLQIRVIVAAQTVIDH